MIIFQKRGSELNWKWNIYYKLTLSDEIKYLGIHLDKFLNGHYQSQQVLKLARPVGMLSKISHYAQKNELKNIVTEIMN